MNDVIIRGSGALTDVNSRQRIIDLIAVPWNQEAMVFWRGEMWKEVFRPQAFDDSIRNQSGKIRVNREHIKGRTIGKIIEFDPNHQDGLFARVKIVKGLEGDQVLDLAEEDMISASVGYTTQAPGDVILNKEAVPKTRTVVRAFLDHLAMVEDPAFDKAAVLAVREGSPARVTDAPLLKTPNLDTVMFSDALRWAQDYIKNKG